MCDMCVYFVLNIQRRLWLIYPIRIGTALNYNTCYSHTKSPPNVFNFEIRRSFTRYSQDALLGCPFPK